MSPPLIFSTAVGVLQKRNIQPHMEKNIDIQNGTNNVMSTSMRRYSRKYHNTDINSAWMIYSKLSETEGKYEKGN